MILYLAGWQASTTAREDKLIKAGVITHRCFSFANQVKIEGFPYYTPGSVEGYNVCVKRKVGIMMDSGVFSYRSYYQKQQALGNTKCLKKLPTQDEFAELYIDFAKKNHKDWEIYITLDFFPDFDSNFKYHKLLLKRGIRPLPAFHGDASLDHFRKYVDLGHDYVCIGINSSLKFTMRNIRNYLDSMFNAGAKYGVGFHGLAVTKPWAMISYPWKSVDSSSWSRTAGFGGLIKFDETTCRMTTLHVSDRSSSAKTVIGSVCEKQVIEEIEAEGYDWQEIHTDHIARHQYNAATMQKLVRYAESCQSKGHLNHFV